MGKKIKDLPGNNVHVMSPKELADELKNHKDKSFIGRIKKSDTEYDEGIKLSLNISTGRFGQGGVIDFRKPPPVGPGDRGDVPPSSRPDPTTQAAVARLKTDPVYRQSLIAAFTAVGYEVTERAAVASVPAALGPSPPAPHVPLWRERERGINAAKFIRSNYGVMRDGEWHHGGVARADLKNNPGLYNAYTAWIADHPDDKLQFSPEGGKQLGRPRKPDADDRRRAYDRERKRRSAKARQNDIGPR